MCTLADVFLFLIFIYLFILTKFLTAISNILPVHSVCFCTHGKLALSCMGYCIPQCNDLPFPM